MGLLDDIKTGDLSGAFHQVLASGDTSAISTGLTEAFRSNDTPPFPQMVSQMFANATGDQKAGVLNALIHAAPADLQAKIGSLLPGGLGSLAGSISPAQAGVVSPDVVATVAQQVHDQNPGVVEHMSGFFAQHPTLVKTLGSVAMMIAMRKLAQAHR